MRISPLVLVALAAAMRAATPAAHAQETQRLTRLVAAGAGSTNAPLLLGLGLHIEPFGAAPSNLAAEGGRPGPPDAPRPVAGRRPGSGGLPPPSYAEGPIFRRHVEDIRTVAGLVEQQGGKLTVQAQTPFTTRLVREGEKLFTDLEKRGHEIGLHFHEDAHLGRNGGALPVATWAAVMREEVALLKQAGATRVRYWSGGNLFPGVLEAASQAGLGVMSDYKNPRTQRADERVIGVQPWRPAAGPQETDLAGFAQHNPAGKIVYLPDGLFARTDFNSMRRAERPGGDWAYFDFLTESLEQSLRAARPDRVNVFHITVHAGEFRGARGGAAKPFDVLAQWLTQVLAPLVQAGRVKRATFSEMAEAFQAWEKRNPGLAPRDGNRSAGLRPGASDNGQSQRAAPDRRSALQGDGFITFVVNTHDWGHLDESADTVLRLVGIFAQHKVRGEFYLTAPVTEAYAAKHSEVIRRLKETGMAISYHVRAPHPLWRGFDEPLRGLSGAKLAETLRDYETYALDEGPPP